MHKITQVLTIILLGIVGVVSAQAISTTSTHISSGQEGNMRSVSLELQSQIQKALIQRARINTQPSNRALLGATYIGSFETGDGPVWSDNPPVYSGVEAAALIFGGSPSDYVISTNSNTTDPLTITHTAWASSWGVECLEVAENYSLDLGAPGYNDPGGANSATSAYVNDWCFSGQTNYVWLIGDISPSITCPGNITVSNDLGICGAVVNYTVTATDPEDGVLTPIQTAGLPSGSTFPIGTITNTFMVTDSAGNTASCSFNVTVNDTEAPIITCPGDITQNNDLGVCGAVVTYNISATDNCSGGATAEFIQNGGFETGDFTGWSVVDTGSGSYYINNGTFLPLSGAGSLAPITGSFDVVTDQGGAGLHLLSQPFTVPANVQSAIVSWNDRIRNAAGIFSDPNQEFRVDLVDASLNVIQEIYSTNPGDPSTQIGPNFRQFDLTSLLQTLSGQVVSLRFSEQDDMGFFNLTLDDVSFVIENINITQTAGLPSGSTFPVGTTTNTFEATDASGNTSSCSFDVTVNDTEAPSLVCPGDITQNNDPGICGAEILYQIPQPIENCPNTSASRLSQNNEAVNSSLDCQSTLSGHVRIYDLNEEGITTDYQINNVAVGVNTSNGGSAMTVNLYLETQITQPIGNYVSPISTQVTPYATTSMVIPAGNLFIQNIPMNVFLPAGSVVYVEVITPSSADFLMGYIDNLTSETKEGYISCASGVTYGTPLSYGFSYSVVISLDGSVYNGLTTTQFAGLPPGSTFPVGTTTNTFVSTDGSGNSATCSFNVIVVDNEAPVITCAPNATRDTDPGVCQYTVVGTEFDATFTDNCTSGTITNDYNATATLAGAVIPKGVTTVVWTVNDGHGQTATCTTVITVEDNEDPVITCAPNATRDTDPGVCQYTVVGTEFDATFIDNCSDGSITNDLNNTATLAGEILPKGSTTVVWTVVDGNGQTATCTTVITVEDNENPVITCVPNANRDTDPGVCEYTVVGTEFDATFTDNCSDGSITNDYNGTTTIAGEVLPKGVTTVIWTVNDGNGQTVSCTTVITVEDNEVPTIACPADITANTDLGDCFATVSFAMPIAFDNCGIATVV